MIVLFQELYFEDLELKCEVERGAFNKLHSLRRDALVADH